MCNDREQPKSSVRNNVTIQGIAENAKGGAVVVSSDGTVVYVKGLTEWPSDVLGREVVVMGILSEEKLIPDPIIEDDGAISQGAVGLQTVISHAEWRSNLPEDSDGCSTL